MQIVEAGEFPSLSSYALDIADGFSRLPPLYRPAAHIGDSLRDLSAKGVRKGRNLRDFGPELFMQDAYVGRFRDAKVGGRWSILQTAEGHFVETTLPRDGRSDSVQSFYDAREVAADAPAGFLLGGWLAGNYFHWMCQALPTLDYIKRTAHPECRVIIGKPNSWTLQSLELAGIGRERIDIIGDDEVRVYETLYLPFSDFGNYHGHYHGLRPGLGAFYGAMGPSDPAPEETEYIYISRRKTRLRPMRNEEAFEQELFARGFSILNPEELSVSHQIARFRRAKLVVAPHGAGLANLVFCKAGTLVYELLPPHQIRSLFFRIAQYGDLQYHGDCHKAVPSDPVGAWNVKFPRALERVDWLMAQF